MEAMNRCSRILALCVAAAAVSLPMAAQSLTDPAGWQRELDAWRAARDRQMAAPDGWLSLAALDWLKPGFNSLGSDAKATLRLPGTAPAHVGLITVSGPTVQLLSPAGGFPEGLTVDGKPAHEGAISTTEAAPSQMRIGTLSMVVLDRGGRFLLRVKDTASPAVTGYRGLNWYAPDPRRVVLADWTPYLPAHLLELPTAGGASLHLPSPGVARFALDGTTYALEPVLEDPAAHTLLFIVADASNAGDTYPGGRLLYTQIPDNGIDKTGTVVLDFNRLQNPACAYTSFASCPQPPDSNRLGVALVAGEKRYMH